MGVDPWFYAPVSGGCYHLERNCAGLRNAHIIKDATSTEAKRRVLSFNSLRPCRICAMNMDTEAPLPEVD